MRKASSKRLTGCWNGTGGSSAGEPGISAVGQVGRESKLRFGGKTHEQFALSVLPDKEWRES